jgi:hypothetical protein
VLWFLFAMVGLVFLAAWAFVGAVAWALVLAVLALIGGAVLGGSTDPD